MKRSKTGKEIGDNQEQVEREVLQLSYVLPDQILSFPCQSTGRGYLEKANGIGLEI